MASTNKTPHYELSQFLANDKPTYLGDYNNDMSKIDTAINNAQDSADTASTAATNAQTAAENAATTASTAITNAATADSKATAANTSIGTMANLETVEKTTLVGAINEVNTKASVSQVVDSLSGSETTKAPSVRAINSTFKEVKLFESQNGSLASNVNLSESINNFEKIEIVFGSQYYKETLEVRVKHLGTGGIANTPIYWFWRDGSGAAGFFSAWYNLSGTTMTYVDSIRWFQYGTGTSPAIDTNAQVRVFEIYGYRN